MIEIRNIGLELFEHETEPAPSMRYENSSSFKTKKPVSIPKQNHSAAVFLRLTPFHYKVLTACSTPVYSRPSGWSDCKARIYF